MITSHNLLVLKTVKIVPDVGPLLRGRPRFLFACTQPAPYKTYEYFLEQVERLVRSVYEGNIGGEFVDLMGSLISGQMRQAYQQALEDEGDTSFILPTYLQNSLDAMIARQADFDYIYQYYKDIVDARVDGAPIEPLMSRAELWANRYNEAYNEAIRAMAIENGEKLEWVMGPTEDHCPTCAGLNGIVAYASEWESAGVHPQSAPNDALDCGGWNCMCDTVPTERRRSPNAFDRIVAVISKG